MKSDGSVMHLATKGIGTEALAASNVYLLSPVSVKGVNNYTIGTNMLMWDESNSYSIEQIAPTFGQVLRGSDGSVASTMFKCGNAGIPVFDFGLLLSCFTAMAMSKIELGASVPTECHETSGKGISAVWFGNNAVVYGVRAHVLVQLSSSNVQRACKFEYVSVASFVDTRKFVLSRQDNMLTLDTDKGEGICTFPIPVSVHRSFPTLFGGDAVVIEDDPNTPWDEASPLGAVIASATVATNAAETVKRYRSQSPLGSVVVRSDLMFTPEKRYKDASEFIGSLCYTDKQEVALAVNLRSNLFVYQPWFNGGLEESERLKVVPSPKFSEFFNVDDECQKIMRFAKTVTVRALTPAQLDYKMFERIKDAFYDMKLPRLQFASALGKIVIPEVTLIPGLDSTAGENVYCIVPVGSIGANVIVINSEGELATMRGMPWGLDEYFYDITEVINEVF